MYICNECIKRNCHKSPKPISRREGRYDCSHFSAIKGGWSMLELVLDTSPADTLSLLHRFKMQVTETKKGLKVKPNERRPSNFRSRRNKRRSNSKKQSAHGGKRTA